MAHFASFLCIFGRKKASLLWRPGAPWDDLGTILGHWGVQREDTFKSRLGFYQFLVELGDPFRKMFGYIWIEKYNFFIFHSRLFFLAFFGSESGCLGLENQEFVKGGIAKMDFYRNWISHDSRANLSWFWPWDPFS